MEALAPGLYLVGTPIGNLQDISLRALDVLKQADLIACEDTRQTAKLLERYSIARPTVSYHQHNEAARATELVARMQRGERIALVSDAGMPGISDPGFRVARLAIESGIAVVPVPGPSALLAALAASGLATDAFTFRGFLPARRGERKSLLEMVRGSSVTEIFYEAPHRLLDAMADVVEVLGGARPVVMARELTKIHEEFLRGSAGEVLKVLQARASIKGEVVLMIGKGGPLAEEKPNLREKLDAMLAAGVEENAAIKRLAKELGMGRDELHRELQRTARRR